MKTLIEQLAYFAANVANDSLPADVIDDSKRVLLDSIGCALAATEIDKGRIGIQMAGLIGGASADATVFGSTKRSSIYGAAFANAEAINALDFDTVLPPGHVSPYVLPGAIAVAEHTNATGAELIRAVAVAHEISYRFGKSMDYHRTVTSEGMRIPEVLGFASTVFGATAAICLLRDDSAEIIADALGIAAAISPVNSYRTWMNNVPNSSIKYTMPGPVVHAALTAAFAASSGHSGDRRILDDDQFGYRRFIGSERWEPTILTNRLGEEWNFPSEHSYKPYPHCRVLHAPLDALNEILNENNISASEIEAIRCWGEAWVEQPIWLQSDVQHPHQAQFSMAHGLAVGAHQITPGPEWQTTATIANPSVLALMEKISFEPHPDYVQSLAHDGSSRPTAIEVDARGEIFRLDKTYPKGTPTTAESYMSTEEITEKFKINAANVLPQNQIDVLADGILNLENVPDVRSVIRQAGLQ